MECSSKKPLGQQPYYLLWNILTDEKENAYNDTYNDENLEYEVSTTKEPLLSLFWKLTACSHDWRADKSLHFCTKWQGL